MERDDRAVEKYLQEFHPRSLRALQPVAPPRSLWIGRLAAAAVLVLGLGTAIWLGNRRQHTGVPPAPQVATAQRNSTDDTPSMNAIRLTRLALEDEQTFEAQLDDQSRRVLPSFPEEQRRLNFLAKE